jgi:energy-coupling factor transporter ATP-binding protein EcfA2
MPPMRHRLFNAMIRFDHVSYGYSSEKSELVINDLSLTISRGEELAVMGGNGCGKTTLGLLLCGVLKPNTGMVSIEGRTGQSSEAKPIIGFLFQDPDNGLVATTVEREIAFSLENRNMPTDRMRVIVDDIVNLFDMTGYRERLVWNLSGGEKQRLSLAGVLSAGPEILFLDEPASFLDYPGAVKLDEALHRVKAANPELTIIRVTQYPHVAEKYPRILVMGEGRIINYNIPERIFSDLGLFKRTGIRPPYKYLTPKPKITDETTSSDKHPDHQVLVELHDLSFAYEREAAIFDRLSLTIDHGEVFGLIGSSGSGKSTLAQILCGIYQPSKGRIDFAFKGCRAVMSFQQPERQFFLDTCYDEIAYGIKKKYEGTTLIEVAVRKYMDSVGLDYDTFHKRDPHSLSGGEARRLGFAIVVALDADMIIFDEPTCGLDESGLRAFKRMLGNLRADGKTVMIISHNSEIIADMADRVGLLEGGRITTVQPTMEFFSSDRYKEILSVPEIIDYQQVNYGTIKTTHPEAIFEFDLFYA